MIACMNVATYTHVYIRSQLDECRDIAYLISYMTYPKVSSTTSGERHMGVYVPLPHPRTVPLQGVSSYMC